MSLTILLSLALDVVVGGLLVATIVYALRLNRQIAQLRDSRGEMEALVREFSEATAQADAGVKGMRKAAAESGEALQYLIGRADKMREELEQMTQAADALAARLEGAAGRARANAAPSEPARDTRPEPRDLPRAEALRGSAAAGGMAGLAGGA
ncbi:DUF6468 domain-containing protein [Nitrospirillum sp. BR 11164]|uniref:DUF6468 domain-containing protein n=1 Tax=Nitrospirillum sp. BR 11164 TaxID=3104324 RepID=UPI002AFFD3CC|nr:DUF6468 domain-containing protein [Nitrospirillum sp. BR 11164]MEA1651079.1 DUF6468 domain-containing protein [Nitrospirillum sp. BR 11164]